MTRFPIPTILTLVILVLSAGRVSANTCGLTPSAVAFGTYDSLSPTPLDSVGGITFVCRGQAAITVRIEIGPGSSGSPANRTLQSGADTLAYNLYSDALRSTVWGNGQGGTWAYVEALPPHDVTKTLPIYGRMPPQQSAPFGTYSDSLVVTILY